MTSQLDCPEVGSKARFLKVSNQGLPFKRVKNYFKTLIQTIYGNQDKAIQKIAAGEDRTCELLQSKEGTDIGLIIFKNHLTEEFSPLGFKATFEIKTLFVIDAKKNAGKKVATHLLNRLAKNATQLKAKNIFVSVSTTKPESLAFFLSHGFRIKKVKNDAYITGSNEYYLFHGSPEKLLAATNLILLIPAPKPSKLYLEKTTLSSPELSVIEWKALAFYLEGKNISMIISELEDYFGTKISPPIIHKALLKLKESSLKWHSPQFSSTYTIIFINTLYRDESKTETIGELIIGITPNGKKHVLGCCPPGPLPQSYWIGIFTELKRKGLKKVEIISSQAYEDLPTSLNKIYKHTKIVTIENLKTWSLKNLSPQIMGQKLLQEMLELHAEATLVEEQAEIVS